MADNWGFVAAAYGLAAVVLGAYWRRLVRLDRELTSAQSRRGAKQGEAQGSTRIREEPAGVRRPR